MRTRSQTQIQSQSLTFEGLSDDALQHVIAACSGTAGRVSAWARGLSGDGIPHFEVVKGLGCLSKCLLQQLYRLRPRVLGVHSLCVVQKPSHGPWRVMLVYTGKLRKAVVEQARQERVCSIDACHTALTHTLAKRVVPELLGASCSLLELDLSYVDLDVRQLEGGVLGERYLEKCLVQGSFTLVTYLTWADTFGDAMVCSTALLTLRLFRCRLRGPLPELRLPALQDLCLSANHLTGGLEPLRGCTALHSLSLHNNEITGGLDPIRGCTALQTLNLCHNSLTGGLTPLHSCTALQELQLSNNQLTGSIEPLWDCSVLQLLHLHNNPVHITDEDRGHFRACSIGI